MPKITYPRPCPTCGKPVSQSQFYRHKQVCSGHRYYCTQCSMSFADNSGLRHHEEQQHSDHPPKFYCPKCGKGFARKRNRNLHLQTVTHGKEFLVKPCFTCHVCDANFTRKSTLQKHERYVHHCIRRPYEMNLLLHLQRLSHNPADQNEWMFKESRWIKPGEQRVCPCGQTGLSSACWINNTKNGNVTFLGSSCTLHWYPELAKVVRYFARLFNRSTHGIYRGLDEMGLRKFQVHSNTILVKGALDYVKPYNPPIVNEEGQYYVKVKYTGPCLLEGHRYQLWMKAKYNEGRLVMKVVTCVYSPPNTKRQCCKARAVPSSTPLLLNDLS